MPVSSSSPDPAFFFQAEGGIRDKLVTGVQTCALPISRQGVRENARHEIRRAARGEADYQLDRTRRVRLRERLAREKEDEDETPHDSAESRADNKAPSFGGLDSRPTLTLASRSADDATGPIEATSVRLSAARSASLRPSCPATANRFLTCSALVNTAASISPRSSAPISSASGRVSAGSDQR